MPSLNFQKQFADLVSGGQKTQTIRANRKFPIKVGDTLHLFTGMRTKACRKLGVGRCISVKEIAIGVGIHYDEIMGGDCLYLTTAERAKLARADGFSCATELLDWFRSTHGLPFCGHVIQRRLT